MLLSTSIGTAPRLVESPRISLIAAPSMSRFLASAATKSRGVGSPGGCHCPTLIVAPQRCRVRARARARPRRYFSRSFLPTLNTSSSTTPACSVCSAAALRSSRASPGRRRGFFDALRAAIVAFHARGRPRLYWKHRLCPPCGAVANPRHPPSHSITVMTTFRFHAADELLNTRSARDRLLRSAANSWLPLTVR